MSNKYLDDMGAALFVAKIKELLGDAIDDLATVYQAKEAGKGLSTNDLTDLLLAKLVGIEDGANNYTLPSTLPASMITPDSINGFISDVEKALFADKYTKAEVDNKLADIVTGIDWKEAVDTVADLSTEYPDAEDGWTASVKGKGIYQFDGTEWVCIIDNDSVTPLATAVLDGLMSKEDYVKLAGIEDGANNYTHPTTPGNKHVPAGGTVGQVLYNQADGVGEWKNLPSAVEMTPITNQEIDDMFA